MLESQTGLRQSSVRCWLLCLLVCVCWVSMFLVLCYRALCHIALPIRPQNDGASCGLAGSHFIPCRYLSTGLICIDLH